MSEAEKAKTVWGQRQAQYLADLQDQQVTIVFQDGKALQGALVGVDQFFLFIRQTSGLEVMVSKGAVKYLHPAAK